MLCNQRGQAVLEFAFVLPLFFLFFAGVIYTALAFVDYLSFNDIARSCAREAALGGSGQYTTIRQKYINAYVDGGYTHMYQWNPGNQGKFLITDENTSTLSDAVKVTIVLDRGDEDILAELGMPETITIRYSMHKETQ